MKLRLPRSTQNWLTLSGAMIALISLSMIVFLFVISMFWSDKHTYLGLVIYILLPSVMIIGLLLIPLGMWLTVRKEKRTGVIHKQEWPRMDLNEKTHRHAFFIFTIGTTIFLFLSAVGSYEAFHYTESVEFCGTLCHNLMIPEYTAYQHSPHARVACVECHVGSGADWYVRSKLSGAYQVYATLADDYPRPIPTPIQNLRPARETCETCHWPQKFYARKLRKEVHFLQDEENTRWDIQLLMKIGGENVAEGYREGIHWHINPNIDVEYIARGDDREELPYVRYTNHETGEVIEYHDEDDPLDEEEIKEENMRSMDCIDCHNRPSHDYRTPVVFINQAIAAGDIPADLPEIKYTAVELCDQTYGTMDSAMAGLAQGLTEFYEDNYPEVIEEEPEKLQQAIAGVQAAYGKNIFPEMKVRWDAYPNHIGHLDYDGCFRCHNDRHVSDNGDVISRDCNACHLIIAQGTPDEMQLARTGESLEFMHPDGEEDWKESLCTDCHGGLNP